MYRHGYMHGIDVIWYNEYCYIKISVLCQTANIDRLLMLLKVCFAILLLLMSLIYDMIYDG